MADDTSRTLAGVVLGTVGYMSPEQVRGRTVDHRTDIFALGAVLYEMLSGRRAFHGETTADTMTAILTEDPPDLPSAERHISPALARIVHRCLEKSPAARFQSAGDLAFALDGSSEASSGVEAIRVQKPSRRREFAWTTAAAGFVLSALGIAAVMGLFNRVAPDPVGYQSSIVLPPGLRPSTGLPAYGRFAVSPDGRRLAVVVIDSAGRQLVWVRPLDSLTGQTLTGTDGASYPFWSADSRSVGFIAQGKLKTDRCDGRQPTDRDRRRPLSVAGRLDRRRYDRVQRQAWRRPVSDSCRRRHARRNVHCRPFARRARPWAPEPAAGRPPLLLQRRHGDQRFGRLRRFARSEREACAGTLHQLQRKVLSGPRLVHA